MQGQKHFTLFGILSFFIVLLSSCGGGASGGAIFSAIEGEVKLGKKTAPWAIRSMVYYNGSLYCTNGNKILSKGGTGPGGWSTISTQYDGGIALLAADDSNLYILTFKPSTDVTSINQGTYNYSDTQLNVLYGSTGVVSGISNVVRIFDNKAIGGREAFATTANGTTYKLNGTTATSVDSDKASAVKVGGSTHRIQSFISTSDYTNSRAWYVPLNGNGSSLIGEGGTRNTPTYTINGINSSTIDLNETTGDDRKDLLKANITGLAYYEEPDSSGTTKEYLLVATTQGYYSVTLDATKIVTRCPQSNGEQLAGQGIIEGSFWTFSDGSIYAGVTTADNSRYGLWSYYPGSTWNLN